MGCFNIVFLILLGAIYFYWPELMQVEGFWFSIGAIWLVFIVSFILFGDVADEPVWRQTYRNVVVVVVGYAILQSYLAPPPNHIVETDDDEVGYEVIPPSEEEYPGWKQTSYNLVGLLFGLYTLIVMMKLRSYIRSRYRIPETTCHGCEDCCCVFWCGCCTVAQMARHTAKYEAISEGICCTSACCSPTGLPPSAESSTLHTAVVV